ncbi:PREDICTED: uncharacterized protein LOC105556978 [Vollenhovia emeryi]|uniref:uncharacterized protein LOC105556978 n=1 Tax=Vollenhovia emeryi TaxID=411798 RepID=UPI0005F4148C|nr:PREDICTED: uncharacterized protein LOC105556978 [Vollenhovia emeryi]
MRYFPNNTTASFTTELPQTLHLHGEWEVALSEIQFPATFLHINHGENIISFVDIKKDRALKKDAPYSSTEGVIPNGIYKNIDELIAVINKEFKNVDSHFYLENTPGGKIYFSVICGDECELIHHMSVSDNLLQILDVGYVVTNAEGLNHTTLTATKPNSKETFTAHFIKLGFKTAQGARYTNFFSREPHGLSRGIPDKLFVYCDICEPYITGDVQTPLLRIVPLELHDHSHYYTYAANQVVHFAVPDYIPLRQTNFRRIEIDIMDQLGKRFPFQSGTLTVTLHFRRFQ